MTPEYLLKEIQNKLIELHSHAAMALPPKHHIKKLCLPLELNKYPRCYFGGSSLYQLEPTNIEQVLRREKEALSLADFHLEAINKLHEENLILIEDNKKALSVIEKVLSNYGIYKEYKDYSGKKTVTRKSSYIEDIYRVFDLDDGYHSVVRQINEFKEQITKHAQGLIYKFKEEEKVKREKLKNDELAYLSVKYKLGKIGTADDLISKIYTISSRTMAFYINCLDNEDIYHSEVVELGLESLLASARFEDSHEYGQHQVTNLLHEYLQKTEKEILDDYEQIRNNLW